MVHKTTFLAICTTLLRIIGIEIFKEKKIVADMFARSFWTASSLNFDAKSLYFEAMFMTLVGTNVETL